MFKQHVRANFLETTKVFGLLRKKRIYILLPVIPGSQGHWCILNLEVRLCTNRYVFLCAMLASHLDPFIFNILLWKKKLSWPQVFVVQKLFKFPGRGGAPALLWWQLQQNPEHFRGNNPHQVMLSPARSGGNSNNMMELQADTFADKARPLCSSFKFNFVKFSNSLVIQFIPRSQISIANHKNSVF